MRKLSIEKLSALFLILVSAATLCSVMFFEYVLEVKPCILCLYQRVPFYIGGALGAILYIRPQLFKFMMLVCIALFLVNVGVAGYNILIENGIMESTGACKGGEQHNFSVESLKTALSTSNVKQLRACDDVSWTLFGIPYLTLAVMNFFLSLGMVFLAVVGLVYRRNR